MQFCMTVGFFNGDAGMLRFTDKWAVDTGVLNLAQKISFGGDPKNGYSANCTGHLRAILTVGRVMKIRAPCLRGGAGVLLSRNELTVRCRADLTFARRDPAKVDRIAAFADAVTAALTAGDDSAQFSQVRLC
jgi:hypothetical protein